MSVLVLLRSGDARAARRLRRRLRSAADLGAPRPAVVLNAEVVCVDGVHDIEAVVIRHTRTGRVWAVNASGFVSAKA